MSAVIEPPLHDHPRFDLRQPLGEGGFGVVWEAWDRRHAQPVALKVLHRGDPTALRRFKTEFRALANLAHDNLVSLFELHQEDERWFFTMELVDGTTFNEWVAPRAGRPARAPSVVLSRPPSASAARSMPGGASAAESAPTAAAMAPAAEARDEGHGELARAATSDAPRGSTPTPLAMPDPFFGIEAPDDETRAAWDATRPAASDAPAPEPDLARLRPAFAQLVEALAWLHGSGHLHRDVKPSNVLVTRAGAVKVLDFGLVTRFWVAGDLAPADALIGTPVYMAPEVCAGLAASPASDWYSVGVMLYWILTGQLPFAGDLGTVVLAKQGLDARPPSEVARGVPADLDRLCRRLLARNPLERPTASELLTAFGARAGEGLSRAPAPASFVGRRAEVATLAAAFAEPVLVRSGPDAGPTLVEVAGLSGTGKTSLVEHVLRELEGQGALVLRSRCFERGSVRYKALDGAIDDLARWLASLSRVELDELLPADRFDRAALYRLFPALPRASDYGGAASAGERDGAIAEDADPQEVKRRAFAALRRLVHDVARVERVVVAIDDAQWADEDSVGPLAELLRPGRGAGADGAPEEEPAVGWLVAYRSDEQDASPFLRAFAAQLVALVPEARRRAVVVGPLPDDEALSLARDRLGPSADPERVAAIAREAAGHPLLIDELARARPQATSHAGSGEVHAAAHADLATLLRARLGALPASARTLVELVALAGEPVDVQLVRAATGADQRDLTALLQDRLLRSRPGARGETVVAWHDRVRETAVASLDPATRTRRHLALAEAAERVGGADPYFLHVHWRGAGDRVRAREHGIAAAEAAMAAFAFDRAVGLYRDCLALSDAPDRGLRERLADALKSAGRGIEAGKAYLDAAASAGPDARRLEIAAAEQFIFAGGLDEGAQVIAKVLGRIGVSYSASLPAIMAAMTWQTVRLKLRGTRWAARAEADVDPELKAVVDTLWSVTIGLSLAEPFASVSIQKRHLRLALDLGEPYRLMRALSIELAFSGLPGGNDDRVSRDLSARGHAIARSLPHPYGEAFMTMSDGGTHWLRGRWVEAQRAVESALAVFDTACVGVAWEKDTARFVRLSALLHRGRLPELAQSVDAALADATSRGDRFFETQLRTRFLPFLALAEGRTDAIAADLEQALAGWAVHGYQVVHFYAWLVNVQVHLYRGRADLAHELFVRGTKPAKRSMLLMGQYYRAQFHELAGRVALARGDAKAALAAGKQLIKEDMAWTRPTGQLLVGLALAATDRARAADALERAAVGFRVADMELHRLAAERAAGRLAGPSGDGRVAVATAGLAALGVVETESFFRSITWT